MLTLGRICDDVEDEYYRSIWVQDPHRVGKNILPVSNIEHEQALDLEKRQIFIVSPSSIYQFEEDFSNMLKSK